MQKAFAWVEEQHTLGFLRSKITVYIDILYKSIFYVPSIGRLYISYQNSTYHKEDKFNEI